MNMNVTAALFYSAMQHLNKIQRKKESDSNYRSLKRTPLRCHVMVYVMITTNYSIAYYLKSFFCNIEQVYQSVIRQCNGICVHIRAGKTVKRYQ